MRPNPQAADPFGRPDLATRTTLIWASRTTATPGSVWPTRAGSDQAALDKRPRCSANGVSARSPLQHRVHAPLQRHAAAQWSGLFSARQGQARFYECFRTLDAHPSSPCLLDR